MREMFSGVKMLFGYEPTDSFVVVYTILLTDYGSFVPPPKLRL